MEAVSEYWIQRSWLEVLDKLLADFSLTRLHVEYALLKTFVSLNGTPVADLGRHISNGLRCKVHMQVRKFVGALKVRIDMNHRLLLLLL